MESTLSLVPKPATLDKSTFPHLRDKLPNSLFAKNRARFIKMFNDKMGDHEGLNYGFFKGSSEVPLYSSDCCYPDY